MSVSRVVHFIVKEFREALAPIAFFFIAFNLVELTTQLILAQYFVRLGNYMLATTTALVVGKAVLVADALPFLRRFDEGPMIRPILFKTFIYWGVVFLARILEGVIEFWIDSGSLSGFGEHAVAMFTWQRFAAIQIWIFVLFLMYTFINELNRRLGEGRLFSMLFRAAGTLPGVAHRRAV